MVSTGTLTRGAGTSLNSECVTNLLVQVIVVQSLRPDRLRSAMERFASRSLSVRELSPETLNLKRLYEQESLAHEPILIIISPGSDPSQVSNWPTVYNCHDALIA